MNPKFEIGQRVKVKAIITLHYDDDKNRFVHKEPVNLEAIVIGMGFRRLGKYIPAHGYHNPFNGDSDYEPAYLDVTGSVLVVKVRKSLFGKEFEASPDDVEVL